MPSKPRPHRGQRELQEAHLPRTLGPRLERDPVRDVLLTVGQEIQDHPHNPHPREDLLQGKARGLDLPRAPHEAQVQAHDRAPDRIRPAPLETAAVEAAAAAAVAAAEVVAVDFQRPEDHDEVDLMGTWCVATGTLPFIFCPKRNRCTSLRMD